MSESVLRWQTQDGDLDGDPENPTSVHFEDAPPGDFVKLVTASIWETRQTEFARRSSPVPEGFPEYGNSVGGPVADRTLLRIVRTHSETEALLTGFTSVDGETWGEAGTWTMPLDATSKIGLVSMGGAGYEAVFHRVTVSDAWTEGEGDVSPVPVEIAEPSPSADPSNEPYPRAAPIKEGTAAPTTIPSISEEALIAP